MNKLFPFFLCCGLIGLATGCDNEKEPIPAYLDLQPFTVNAPGGAGWQKITEGWLYVNGEFLGAYSLPGIAPVLVDGEATIWLYPGVKENGITETPNIYDFFTRYETKVTPVAGENTTIYPSCAYKTDITFPWDLDRTSFDGASGLVFENRDDDIGNAFSITADGAFAGKSLKIAVDSIHPLLAIASEQVALPYTGAQQTWLELHYRNDMPFTLSLLGSTSGSSEREKPVYQFNNTEEWNKIYINLTDYLTDLGDNRQRLFFRAQLPKNTNGSYSQTTGTVLLDNIRLVHF